MMLANPSAPLAVAHLGGVVLARPLSGALGFPRAGWDQTD